MYTYGDKLIAGNNNSLAIFSGLDKHNKLNHQLGVSDFSYGNGVYWASRYNKGLMGYKYNEQSNNK